MRFMSCPDLDDARRPEPGLLPEKRNQGRTHSQAVIALARRRIDVLWALLRDNRTWTPAPPDGEGRVVRPRARVVPCSARSTASVLRSWQATVLWGND